MLDKNQDVTNEDIMAMLAGELLPSDIHARRAEKSRKRAVGKRQIEIEAELEKHSTGKLLAMRRSVYRGTEYAENDTAARNEAEAFVYALYAVLKRRPHVPGKVEGEKARRNAATAHHGPKKAGGRRPRFNAPIKVSARRLEQNERKFEAWFAEKQATSSYKLNRDYHRRLYRFYNGC